MWNTFSGTIFCNVRELQYNEKANKNIYEINFRTCWSLSSSKCSSANSNQILLYNRRKGLVFVVVDSFYLILTLHAFQVSTHIDFLIT